MSKPAWTITVRLAHWLVATGVLINLFNETGDTHRLIGYACVVMIALRIAHGLSKAAPQHSRFYLPRLMQIKQHVSEVVLGRIAAHQGHNPLGMLAVYLIWVLIAFLAFTGWLSRTDAYWGEDGPVLAHLVFSNLLLGLVVLHVIAVFVMSRLQKRNLVKAMLTGGSSVDQAAN